MNYKEQTKSPKWQKKRLEVLELRGFKCEECKCEDKQLHVHHRFYIKGRKYWEYDNDVLQVLCEDCHQKEHEKPEKNIYNKLGVYLVEAFHDGFSDETTIQQILELLSNVNNNSLLKYLIKGLNRSYSDYNKITYHEAPF